MIETLNWEEQLCYKVKYLERNVYTKHGSTRISTFISELMSIKILITDHSSLNRFPELEMFQKIIWNIFDSLTQSEQFLPVYTKIIFDLLCFFFNRRDKADFVQFLINDINQTKSLSAMFRLVRFLTFLLESLQDESEFDEYFDLFYQQAKELKLNWIFFNVLISKNFNYHKQKQLWTLANLKTNENNSKYQSTYEQKITNYFKK